MFQFSTDALRPHERFDHWCEVRAKSLFGVTISLGREQRPQFQGRFSAVAVGGATFAEMHASTYYVSRTWADIDRMASDSLCIAEQVRGPGWMDIGKDRVQQVANGAMAISHSDMPFIATPARTDGFHYRVLKIPLAGRDILHRPARNLEPLTLVPAERLTALIAASFNEVVTQGTALPDADMAVQHLGQLALLARGRVRPGTPESRLALRFGHLQAARQVMSRASHRFDLSPAFVANGLGISLRQVHMLFEPGGLSFSRTLTAMRLEKARQALQSEPTRQVADIAFACGFDSMATFYRTFRSAYGLSPSDIRAMVNAS